MGIGIQVEGLTKSFGRQVIWQDVSLTLPAGEISVMLGPSGTGKSVFLKTLVGLLRPDHGSIMIQGRDLSHVPITLPTGGGRLRRTARPRGQTRPPYLTQSWSIRMYHCGFHW